MFWYCFCFPQDVCDLFGSDLPAEGKGGARFEWRDGPFLNALKKGDWIVLDEVSPKFWYKKIRKCSSK